MRQFRFSPGVPHTTGFTAGDALIVLGFTAVLYTGARIAFYAPAIIAGPGISLGLGAPMVRVAIHWADGRGLFPVASVQPLLWLCRRAQSHRAKRAHAVARRPPERSVFRFCRSYC